MDMIDFYLKCPMEIDAYMCINEDQIPTGIIEKYNLKKIIENGKLRLKLLKAMLLENYHTIYTHIIIII